MSGLRRAKTRQAKSRGRKLEEADWRKAREETLREAVKKTIKILVILRDTAGEIGQLITKLEAEFEKLTELEKDEGAARYLERLNDFKEEQKKISKEIDVQLDTLMETQTELDGLAGANERHLRLTERQAATMGFSSR